MTEASWQCPDPQCGGVLNRHKSKRVAIDPRTDQEVGPVLTWAWGWIQVYDNSWMISIGFVLQFLVWLGVGSVILVFFPGKAIHSPLATVCVALDFVAGTGVNFVWFTFFEKQRKAALARAVWYERYRCERCRKWWLFPEADHPETISSDGGRQTEEQPAG